MNTSFFEAIKEIRDAARKGHLALLYVYDSSDGAKKIKNFETSLFKNENLGVAMKVFRCLKLDIARDKPSKQRFGKKVPRFITFNAKGQKVDDLYLKGYRAKAGSVFKILAGTAKGHGKLPLGTFVKKYRSFLNDLDKLEAKKTTCAKKKARLGEDCGKSKMKKITKDQESIAREEKSLLERERKLLESVKAYIPSTKPRRVAAR